MKYVIFAILGTLAYFVVGYILVGLGIVALPLFRLQTKVGTNYEIIQKTYDADNVLYNYEWFKERYEAIQAVETKIAQAEQAKRDFDIQAGVRTSWTFEDKTESSRLGAVFQGLKNYKEDIVAEYNARAKMANRNIFQDSLPMFISL